MLKKTIDILVGDMMWRCGTDMIWCKKYNPGKRKGSLCGQKLSLNCCLDVCRDRIMSRWLKVAVSVTFH